MSTTREAAEYWLMGEYNGDLETIQHMRPHFRIGDMIAAFEAGATRYNDLLQSWSECRGELQKERNLVDTLRSALKEEAQRSEAYLAAYRSATEPVKPK